MKKDAYRFSGDAPRNYDNYLGPFLFEPYAKYVANMLPASAQNILEICSGTGRLTRHLVEKLPPAAKLTASDLSADMLAIAREKIKSKQVDFMVADAQQLPFPDNSFDYVFCQFGLMFFPDKQKGFNEVFRVLKPKGKFIFATWDKTENIPVHKIYYNDILFPFFGKETGKFLTPFILHKEDELLTFLTNAGFKNNSVENIALKGSSESASQIVNGYLLKHSLGEEVKAKDPDALPVMAEKLLHALTENFGTGKITVKLSAFVGEGEK